VDGGVGWGVVRSGEATTGGQRGRAGRDGSLNEIYASGSLGWFVWTYEALPIRVSLVRPG
jgi:hypothetical protein